jgi:hypothetical protein
MATITLEYNVRNSVAKRIIEIILAMDNVFKVKSHVKPSNNSLTQKAIQDVENGNIVTCGSYENYLKQTAQYA